MRYISIFSGIEAATVAWEPLGWEPVAFCEIDAFPSSVLAHRFPDVPNLGDITEVDWKEVISERGTVDVVIGGSPCQSFSIAGGRDSLRGESRLCFEFVRCIGEVAPTWFVWENVPGVFSTRDNAFGQFIGALEELGYGMAWRTLDAQFFGVAQRRRRVFLVGHAGGMVGAASAVLFERESVRGNTQPSRAKREELARTAGVGADKRVWGGTWSINSQMMAESTAQGKPESFEISPTLDTRSQPHAVASFLLNPDFAKTDGYLPDMCRTLDTMGNLGILCMADITANAAIDCDMAGTLHTDHPQIICMASDTANAAIDEDVVGTLHVGGGFAADSVGAICARDYKGVGNQYVEEGKLICQRMF